ncbi:MAG: NFACT family protein [Campylobacterota bacterium]|nr:NFACT family protein [Campylobacterota bacterium]
MKFSHLQQIVTMMQDFKNINAIYRVNDTTIKIAFDRDDTLYFDMQKGEPYIFTCKDYKRSKIYQAPFDIVLAKQFNRSYIHKIECYNADKILRIHASLSSAYKESSAILQLEFTGKTANVIILDTQGRVLEALRHIDAQSSYRVVRVGQELLDPPPPPYTPKAFPIDNMEAFLQEAYLQKERTRLNALKKSKTAYLEKKLAKLERLLKTLPSQEKLESDAQSDQQIATLILANIYQIKPYSQDLELYDFDGKPVVIEIPKAFTNPSDMAEHFFKNAKRLKKKAASLYIEREGLEEKVRYLRYFIQTVDESKDLVSLQTLFPPRNRQKKQIKEESIETFWIEGYKVMLGKSEKGNIALLSRAKARDIWLHLKERPSAHVIIVTDKQNVPQNVIEYAAKICVDFSVFEKGNYLVDYTPRREVKIQEGANVLYNKYKTINISKG